MIKFYHDPNLKRNQNQINTSKDIDAEWNSPKRLKQNLL